jgi:diphthamide synthase (EF-2-diphthine--ammonia ligase)
MLDAPFFRKRIELLEVERVWMGGHGVLRVVKAGLVGK